MQIGSRAAERYLFKIQPGGPSMEDARSAILDALPEARVIDSRESNPLITRGLDQATTFLSLISLIALIAILASWLSPYDPYAPNILARRLPPIWYGIIWDDPKASWDAIAKA